MGYSRVSSWLSAFHYDAAFLDIYVGRSEKEIRPKEVRNFNLENANNAF